MTTPLVINGTTYDYPETGDTQWGAEASAWAQAVSVGLLQKSGGLFQLLAEVDFGTSYGLKSLYYKSRSNNVASAGQIRLARGDVLSFRNQANSSNLDLAVNTSNQLTFAGIEVGALVIPQNTNSIDLSLSTYDLSADLNLSAGLATPAYQLVTLTIESDGLKAEISDASIISAIPDATSLVTGLLTSADWTTFNSKQAAGSYITALTGNVVATGPGSVTATIQSNVIVNSMINSSAAIAYSKLALSNSILNADINSSAAIAYSKLSLSNSILNADINTSAAIAYSKLNLTTSIVNGDINASAAIALTKLAATTASRALVSDGSGFVSAATTTSTQLGYLSSATGTTGTTSTNLVFSTSPTLVTPTLGAALATTITFPATQVPSADPNTLDDYEEGSWTPAFSPASGSGITYTSQSGRYTKIGNMVYVAFEIEMSAKGTASGGLLVTGLPFTVENPYTGSAEPWAFTPSFIFNMSTSITNFGGYCDNNTTSIVMRISTAASTTYPGAQLQVSDVATNFYIQGSASYRTT